MLHAVLRSFAAAVWGYPQEVVDRWMNAPEGTLFLGDDALGSTLYVREAYIALYEKLEAEKKRGFAHAVVSGNSWAGKVMVCPLRAGQARPRSAPIMLLRRLKLRTISSAW